MSIDTKNILTPTEVSRSKLSKIRSEYNDLAKLYIELVKGEYIYCPMCGKHKKAKTNFYTSPYTKDGYNHYACKECCIEMATDINKAGTMIDNEEKAKYVLSRLDLPYIDTLYKGMLEKIDKNGVIDGRGIDLAFVGYVTMVRALPQYSKLTWKDSVSASSLSDGLDILNTQTPRDETKKIFGEGLNNADYMFLQNKFDDWKARTKIDTVSQETYIANICSLQLDIYKARREGRDVSKMLDTLNKQMEAANLQPKQNVGNSSIDGLTFGQLIEKWELEKPIPEPSEEFKDVDGIGKYIRVWFKGCLSKALGLTNGYSKEYEEELRKYTVEKPKPQDGEATSDEIYASLFGNDGDLDVDGSN